MLAWRGVCLLGGRVAVHAGRCSICMHSPLPLAPRLLLQLVLLSPLIAAICLLRHRMQGIGRRWPRKPAAAAGSKCGLLLQAAHRTGSKGRGGLWVLMIVFAFKFLMLRTIILRTKKSHGVSLGSRYCNC